MSARPILRRASRAEARSPFLCDVSGGTKDGPVESGPLTSWSGDESRSTTWSVSPFAPWLVCWLLLTACSGRVEEQVLPFSDVSRGSESSETGMPLHEYSSPASEGVAVPWCSDASLPTMGRREAGAAELTKIALYQGVEVVLGESASVDVVAGRDALIRAFVAPDGAILNGAVLQLESADGKSHFFEDLRDLFAPSSPGTLDSTYRFFVPGHLIQPTTRLTVQVFRQGSCAAVGGPGGARFPDEGSFALAARQVGGLQVVAVPVIYGADGSERPPRLGSLELQDLARHLEALAPVSSVELTLHAPVITEEVHLEEILAELMHLRHLERPPNQTIYFGFVRPADTMDEYCSGSCVAGVSAVGSASGHGSTGIGVAFDETRAETFIHEMGHILRLKHAPCGDPTDADAEYPHLEAQLGTWGFDLRTARLVDPAGRARDFMSYCDPSWISDFHYQKLLDRIAFANTQLWSDVVQVGGKGGVASPTAVPDGAADALMDEGAMAPHSVRSEAIEQGDLDAVEFVYCLHHR